MQSMQAVCAVRSAGGGGVGGPIALGERRKGGMIPRREVCSLPPRLHTATDLADGTNEDLIGVWAKLYMDMG